MVDMWLVGFALVLGIYIIMRHFIMSKVKEMNEPREEEESGEEESEEGEDMVNDEDKEVTEEETVEEENESMSCKIIWSMQSTPEYIGKTMTFENLTKTEANELKEKVKQAYSANEKILEYKDTMVGIQPLDYLNLVDDNEEDTYSFDIEYEQEDE